MKSTEFIKDFSIDLFSIAMWMRVNALSLEKYINSFWWIFKIKEKLEWVRVQFSHACSLNNSRFIIIPCSAYCFFITKVFFLFYLRKNTFFTLRINSTLLQTFLIIITKQNKCLNKHTYKNSLTRILTSSQSRNSSHCYY